MQKLILFFLLFPQILLAQDTIPFRIVFYNVENLFDTHHDSLKNDQEFLSTSIRAWHYGRYKKKLSNISKVITAIGEWEPPALVGLCEVENNRVLRDLIYHSPLKEHSYRYIMTDSPDDRGIDVALMYQRDKFRLLSHRSIRLAFKEVSRRSRDILHVTGSTITRDTLDVFIVHFPSRSEGEKETEPYRLEAALTLRNAVDSIIQVRVDPRVLIMGDFNDYPRNKSISQVLNAQIPPEEKPEIDQLYHLLADKEKRKNYGSYKYKGSWGLLDHIIVSGGLLDSRSCFYTNKDLARVVDLPFLLQEDEKYGGIQPFRTYYGRKYIGGFSDHLPVMADFILVPRKR